MARYLYSELANAVAARLNCIASGNQECKERWTRVANELAGKLPHGSGFDNGTRIDLDASHAEKLVLLTSFHHMNEAGYYCGWSEHTVTVTPSFSGINVRVSGRNVNDIKGYIAEEFDYSLGREMVQGSLNVA